MLQIQMQHVMIPSWRRDALVKVYGAHVMCRFREVVESLPYEGFGDTFSSTHDSGQHGKDSCHEDKLVGMQRTPFQDVSDCPLYNC